MLNGAVPKAPFDSWLKNLFNLTGAHLVPRFLLCDNAFFRRSLMTENAVLQLRAERLRAQHVLFLPAVIAFVAANASFAREIMSLFDNYPSTSKKYFCLLMFDTEPMKPSNTGRLLLIFCLIPLRFNGRVPNPRKFAGSGAKPRLSANGGLSRFDADEQREVIFTPPADKPPLFSCSMVPGQKLARCFVKVRI